MHVYRRSIVALFRCRERGYTVRKNPAREPETMRQDNNEEGPPDSPEEDEEEDEEEEEEEASTSTADLMERNISDVLQDKTLYAKLMEIIINRTQNELLSAQHQAK